MKEKKRGKEGERGPVSDCMWMWMDVSRWIDVDRWMWVDG